MKWSDHVRDFCSQAWGLALDFWRWLDGKKTGFAAAYWILVECVVPIIWPAETHPTLTMVLTAAGAVLTVLGLGHKAYKAAGTTGA